MAGFENYSREVADLEREIIRRGLVLGLDWNDEAAIRLLARDALDCRLADGQAGCDPESDPRSLAKLELFGLAQLMIKVMGECAADGMEVHGGPVWKIFGGALWRERGMRESVTGLGNGEDRPT